MIITGGKFKGRKIQAPDERITRPTLSKVRQGVFNTLFSILGEFEDLKLLDLFGGSGIMGLEALSRGFKEVLVYEKNPKIAQVLKCNYKNLGLVPNLKIGDSLKLLKKTSSDFNVVYIDPPYYSGIYDEIFLELENIRFKNCIIVVEHSEPLNKKSFELIKEKNYGGKLVSFFRIQSKTPEQNFHQDKTI